jgi:hypothetical protein
MQKEGRVTEEQGFHKTETDGEAQLLEEKHQN